MFKKLKDKLAEEVKSSPQRIQQFAQAAQAAVTSASSSISDITNNDLFSIGDNDIQHNNSTKSKSKQQISERSSFQDVSLEQASTTPTPSTVDLLEYSGRPDSAMDNSRQRRLSNSSFASDVSFRLPSYESPSMYHLQSDMDVSASEAEERGFSNSAVSLDRVTKEQLYSAYRRTQERYTKYRTQYADLARHYKLLERENAKARSVLVETQDKALRRISELREQCSLEQSAKAHLEKALRIEIDERNLKIEALETKVKILRGEKETNESSVNKPTTQTSDDNDNNDNLITLTEIEKHQSVPSPSDLQALNGKIEKLEQLLNKYKESFKTTKEKNSQLTSQLQMLNTDLKQKHKEIESMSELAAQLDLAKQEIQNLNAVNEELHNKIRTQDFAEIKEISTLKLDLQKSEEEIRELQNKVEVFTKREEENAISLAENKLSIHKELESKEAEIKSLKDSLTTLKKEIQSLNIVITDYKAKINNLEADKNTLNSNLTEYSCAKSKITTLETDIQELSEKCQALEQFKIKLSEEHKCLQLQMKQEMAEKLAMKDRIGYLENRNQQLSEENSKKTSEINNLEIKFKFMENHTKEFTDVSERETLIEEINSWKSKYEAKNTEIQEEREELVKLQSEIEKLIANHELLQDHNLQLNEVIAQLKLKQNEMQKGAEHSNKVNKNVVSCCRKLITELNVLKEVCKMTAMDFNALKKEHLELSDIVLKKINAFSEQFTGQQDDENWKAMYERACYDKKIVEEELNSIRIEHKNTSNEARNLRKQIESLNENMQKTEKESIEMQQKLKKIDLLMLENSKLEKDVKEFKLAHDNLYASSTEMSIQQSNSLGKIEQLEHDRIQLEQTVGDLNNTNSLLEDTLKNVKHELQNATDSIMLLEKTNQKLTEENVYLKSQYKNVTQSFETLEKEIGELRKSHVELEAEKDRLSRTISSLENNDIENKKSQTGQTQIIEQLNKTINILTVDIKNLKDKNDTYQSDYNKINTTNKELSDKLNSMREKDEVNISENISLHNIITDLTQRLNTVNIELTAVNNKKVELENVNSDLDAKLSLMTTECDQIRKDKNNVNFTNSELINNISMLTVELEGLKSKINELYKENSLLRNGNADLTEEISSLNGQLDSLNHKIREIEDANIALSNNNHDLSIKMENDSQNNVSSEEYDLLKDENRRLKSDIEGLQSYLTKISKENSQLNDKLREMIASSEHGLSKGDADEIGILKNQIQSHEERIAEISRENMILVEENLELKDQIHSQNGAPIINNENNSDIEKKCSTLESSKNLEYKLNEVEQLNKILNINMQETQQNNEKLRFTNEKLETRLDEALVSLRHLHALQENTELEYLRNILYEYFTGTGNHSLTLAKVIAAVVKFDDSQTKTVLLKEKERQGFLRQLGLL